MQYLPASRRRGYTRAYDGWRMSVCVCTMNMRVCGRKRARWCVDTCLQHYAHPIYSIGVLVHVHLIHFNPVYFTFYS